MNKLTIRARILLGFTVVIIIEVVALLYFSTILSGVNQQVTGLIGIENLVEADRDAYQSHLALLNLLGKIDEKNADTLGTARDAVFTNLGQILERYNVFRKTYSTNNETLLADMAKFDEAYKQLSVATEKQFTLSSGDDGALALSNYHNSYEPAFSNLREMLDLITGATYAQAVEATASISFIINNIALFVGALMAALVTLTFFLAIFITASISRQINTAIRELASSSSQISVASTQLSRASQEIANGAIEQASGIEETSSSIEELASMVKQNANNSVEASLLAEKTVDVSNSGYLQMENLLTAMKAINDESDRIKRIMKVIDDIAFQTNMLALNAAVEAARAGEAGMGFAVVAEEVKNLANRSAAAAQETADMIESSIKKTSEGLELSEKMIVQFRDVQDNAKKLSLMSREVETASRQQDIGIDQVNKAIIQFDEVVQANAGAAEETASAATELQTQVESLNDLVSDLTVIVLGSRGMENQSRTRVYEEKQRKSVDKTRPKQPSRQHEAIEHRETSPREEPSRSDAPKKRSPEKLIPFEDDEDFKDN